MDRAAAFNTAGAVKSITRVRKFWEKPGSSLANSLMKRGCLWNSFVMVGRVDALLRMTRAAMPQLYAAFAAMAPKFETRAEHRGSRRTLFANRRFKFSHQVLAIRPEDLMVMRVGDVGGAIWVSLIACYQLSPVSEWNRSLQCQLVKRGTIMKAIAVKPGIPNTVHLTELPAPEVSDIPNGRGVLVRVLRVGVDGTDKEINAAEYGQAPPG